MDSSQKRAVESYRSRLGKLGLVRFEVLGRNGDRGLLRSLAKRLAEDGPEAVHLRAVVNQAMSGMPPKKGGIVAALRRSPLVGSDIHLGRSRVGLRELDL